jgi:hypothetical protein
MSNRSIEILGTQLTHRPETFNLRFMTKREVASSESTPVTDEFLSDRLVSGNVEQVSALLMRMAVHFRKVCEWIAANSERTPKSLSLHNLMRATAEYLQMASEGFGKHISIVALATRNIYELRLRTEHLLSSREALDTWQAEGATDKIQVLEGILGLDTKQRSGSQRQVLTNEISRIRYILKKHKLEELKCIPGTFSIAKALDKGDEHKNLFKLFSKLVHPSSYLVNDSANAASPEVRSILQTHCQLYAWDLFSRICDAVGVPEDIRFFESQSGG